jgi:hypothetical protein
MPWRMKKPNPGLFCVCVAWNREVEPPDRCTTNRTDSPPLYTFILLRGDLVGRESHGWRVQTERMKQLPTKPPIKLESAGSRRFRPDRRGYSKLLPRHTPPARSPSKATHHYSYINHLHHPGTNPGKHLHHCNEVTKRKK